MQVELLKVQKWDDFIELKEAMFFCTDTADGAWMVVKSDDKKRARLNCMHHFLADLTYPSKDTHVLRGANPLIVSNASSVIVQGEHILGKTLHPQHNANRLDKTVIRIVSGHIT